METAPLRDTEAKSLAAGDKTAHPFLANTTRPRLGLGRPLARRTKLVFVAMGWLLFSVLFMHGLGLPLLATKSTEQPRAGGDPSSPWGFDWFSVRYLQMTHCYTLTTLYAARAVHRDQLGALLRQAPVRPTPPAARLHQRFGHSHDCNCAPPRPRLCPRHARIPWCCIRQPGRARRVRHIFRVDVGPFAKQDRRRGVRYTRIRSARDGCEHASGGMLRERGGARNLGDAGRAQAGQHIGRHAYGVQNAGATCRETVRGADWWRGRRSEVRRHGERCEGFSRDCKEAGAGEGSLLGFRKSSLLFMLVH